MKKENRTTRDLDSGIIKHWFYVIKNQMIWWRILQWKKTRKKSNGNFRTENNNKYNLKT